MISILAPEAELPPADRVWGRENRILPPADREATSWLGLARLLGWNADVRYRDPGGCGAATRCAVVARHPLAADEAQALRARLEREPLLVVAPAAAAGTPLAELAGAHVSGGRPVEDGLRWVGPGPKREWSAWPRVEVRELAAAEDCVTWARIGEAPLVLARPVGNGVVATLAAHPVELADAAPSGSGLLRRLLTRGTPGPLAWLDLEGVVVPRLDDPGSASSAHLDDWAHRSLTEAEWIAVADDLRARDARITVGYVPGWVDDGEPERGELLVDGEPVERLGGRVHPSPLVVYRAASGDTAQDRPAEMRGIDRLRSSGAGELELHGHTHVRPPLEAWARAEDRHERVDWYRELEELEPGDDDSVALGLERFRASFGESPAALCCPGHACSPAAAESAARSGLGLVSAETLGVADGERLVWCDHVRSPYADGAAGPWLQSDGPVVAGLHDRDLVLQGTGWLGERLDEWLAHGARRICDLRELAAILEHRVAVEPGSSEPTVRRPSEHFGPLPRELPIASRS